MSGDGFIGTNLSLLEGVGRGDLKVAYGQTTPGSGSDTVVTGLSYVLAVVACLDGDPDTDANDPVSVSASTGDQAGTPVAGSFLLKSWQDDWSASAANWVKLNWIAIGF